MTTEKRRKVLYLEERIAVVRAMLNRNVYVGADTVSKRHDLTLLMMNILDGERPSVPRKYRHLIRRGNQ